MATEWQLKTFDELSLAELYRLLQLRNAVFIVEQTCPFQDLDDKDQQSYHFMGMQENRLVAYTRLLPAGLAYEEPSIGRVVTADTVRGSGIGRELMQRSIDAAERLFGKVPVRIGAQLYLQRFYESFGFEKCSDIYLEDGIEHIYMLRNPLS